MPRKGLSAAMAALMAGTTPAFCRLVMQSSNAPTPGNTTPSAAAMKSASDVISTSQPTFSSALWTLPRLPIP